MKRIPLAQIEKLARWDADYYKSLSDDDCIVCLTEKEVYLLGQVIEQIRWHNTRWTGDKSGLDFDLITSTVEYKLEERMTCNQLQQIINRIGDIENAINIINNPGDEFDENTQLREQVTPDELEAIGVSLPACGTPEKDALYGGIDNLVRRIHQNNVDALENIAQAGNFSDQVARIFEASPVGVLPLDEAFEYATFIVDELLEEYLATVDETLLENVVCDLFCIAVNSGCSLTMLDVINYFGSKMGDDTLASVTASLAQVVQFAITGTFIGDQYFYFFCFFQMFSVSMANEFFDYGDGLEGYGLYLRAGMNNPDNDWTILCDACPTQYRLFTHDFAYGLGDFTLITGEMQNGRVHGVLSGIVEVIELTMPFDPSWRVVQSKLFTERLVSCEHGTFDSYTVHYRATPGTDVGNIASIPNGGFAQSGIGAPCSGFPISPFYVTGCNEVYIKLTGCDNVGSELYLDKFQINFVMQFAPNFATVHEDSNICV